ncbi:MAG: hypothetical protein ACRDF0_11840 [Candidatus Limnocylindria bacterium]
MQRDDRVATSDFILAAVLVVHGFRTAGIQPDPTEPERRKEFVLLGDRDTFDGLSAQLLTDDVLVPAREFATAQRRLKRLLYDWPALADRPRSGR